MNLNGVWQFAPAAEDEPPPIGRDLAERILVPYPVESALSGIMRSEERLWYRRSFRVPADWRIGAGQRLLLHFGAVDFDARVWVNGVLVATHRGGYAGFDIDVTEAVTPGDGPQELIVWAEDLTDATWQPVGKQRREPDRGIFYQGSSGIWQTVWMEPVPTVHVTGLDMTPDLDAETLRLTVRVGGATTERVRAEALDGDRVVGSVTGSADQELALPVPSPELWSPDRPFLYELRVRVGDAEQTDEVHSYFGMREIGIVRDPAGRPRIALNGEILFNLATLDQGFWPDGLHTAPTDAALRFDLEQHKVLGFNAVRKHIKVEPDRWYYWADRLGLLVWQDMPSPKLGKVPKGPWRDQFEAELRELVRGHRSWTSIVAWVPFNEGWGEWSRKATGRIAGEVKALDPSRLVNAHSGFNLPDSRGDSGAGDVIDLHAYVGPATPKPDDRRVAIDGEHGGFGLRVEGHMWFCDGHAYEMTDSVAENTRRYVENQRDLLAAIERFGLSAGIYTQLTDVEHEINGFLTYDRRVRKLDFDQVLAVNEQIIAARPER
jgi:beta-galactosidase/beta-glucuronidase